MTGGNARKTCMYFTFFSIQSRASLTKGFVSMQWVSIKICVIKCYVTSVILNEYMTSKSAFYLVKFIYRNSIDSYYSDVYLITSKLATKDFSYKLNWQLLNAFITSKLALYLIKIIHRNSIYSYCSHFIWKYVNPKNQS